MSAPPRPLRGRPLVILAMTGVGVVAGSLLLECTQKPESAPAPPPPKVVAPPTPVFEPPPPPPVQEEAPVPTPAPVAKAEPQKPGPRRLTGCDAECVGNATVDLQSALRAKAGQARSCYERALTHNSTLAGSALINVRVGPNGEPCSASVGQDTLGDAAVTNCVVQRFRTGKYPKPAGGCVDVAVPISFVPAQH
jgi:type IV secretory pathway VirB10-like protein